MTVDFPDGWQRQAQYLFSLTCHVLGGTAKLCLTVLVWMRGATPQDTVKLRLAVPPGRSESPG